MPRRYSRRSKIQEKKNKRKAFYYTLLTVILILVFFFYGLPAIAKFASFLTDLKQSSEPVEKQDTTPPVPPRIDSLPEFTNDTEIEITGNTEPGAAVSVYLNSKTKEILANNEGLFRLSFGLQKGENRIYAVSKDSSGNESKKSDSQTVTYDDQPPEFEIASPQDQSTYYGAKERQVVIEGSTEEGASVKINDRIVVVSSDGSFSFLTSLEDGENQFIVIAEDKAGNQTEKSLTLNFSP